MAMARALPREAEGACRDDHPLDLRRAPGMVAERSAVDAVDLAGERRPLTRLDLPARSKELHSALREFRLELLGDRRVQVPAVSARALVLQQPLDLHADGQVG